MKPVLLLCLLLCASGLRAATADEILGLWMTPGGESKIEIKSCGSTSTYCGTIVWMQNPHNDDNNIDTSLRGRPLVGLQIAEGFRFDSEKAFVDGKIYAPKRGRVYKAKIIVLDPQTLQVEIGLLREKVKWNKTLE